VDGARSLATLLELQGHQVLVAHDGPAALGAADQLDPEVVLLDLAMPGMNGLEVATRLRNRPRAGRLLLVAITGLGQPEDRRRTAEAGFDCHLVKPVDLGALRALLVPGPDRPVGLTAPASGG
jgi:CheY-like chemotaxis protein